MPDSANTDDPDRTVDLTQAEKVFREFRELCPDFDQEAVNALCREHSWCAMQLQALASMVLSPDSGDGEARVEPQEEWVLRPDSVVGDYRIVRGLGSGGFGQVYLAQQERPFPRQLALKLLLRNDPGVVGRFKREIRTMACLGHPHIATVLNAGEHEGRQFFTMEYVAGEPLVEYCDKNKLSVEDRMTLFLKVCEGVQHAHQNEIIHRDLKPENILVAENDLGFPVPKIIDFGLVKALGSEFADDEKTGVGYVVGTPKHMSPEQLDGDGKIDRKTDIYALGVVLYELLTGVLHFDFPPDLTLPELCRILHEEDPVRPSARVRKLNDAEVADKRGTDVRQLSRQLSPDLDYIVLRALERDPSRRYGFVSELSNDILRYFNKEPLHKRGYRIHRAKKFVLRNRVRLSLAAAALVVLGVLASNHIASLVRVRGIHRDAIAATSAYEDHAAQVATLYGKWQAARKALPAWAPAWEREEEIELWRELTSLVPRNETLYNEAVAALDKAIDEPVSDVARTDLLAKDEAVYTLHHSAVEEGLPSLRDIVADVPEPVPGSLPDGRRVRKWVPVQSYPPGADVYCFRYVQTGARWTPVAYSPDKVRDDPSQGIAGRGVLVVDRVWPARFEDDPLPPFVSGDTLLQVNGKPVFRHADLAEALAGMPQEKMVQVLVRPRDSKDAEKREWIPFPKQRSEWFLRGVKGATKGAHEIPAGRLVLPYAQLGVTFRGYSLEFLEANRRGQTSAEYPVEIELPTGSYLLVLRKPGYRETRFPIRIPGKVDSVDVRLLKDGTAPDAFVYVPGGFLQTGGDPRADQAFKSGYQEVHGFLLGRFEVTADSWLEFVNDPDIVRHIDTDSGAAPLTSFPEVREAVEKLGITRRTVQLIPRSDSGPHWQHVNGKWEPGTYYSNMQWAAHHISHIAALVYIEWLNSQTDGPLKYRLPTDAEWEWAARGADGRHFVWGDYPLLSFCWSQPGTVSPGGVPPGIVPLDESVFGVRDLEGSVREHTTGIPHEALRHRTSRGGSYDETSEVYFRLASRNGFLPESWKRSLGFRLAADLPP